MSQPQRHSRPFPLFFGLSTFWVFLCIAFALEGCSSESGTDKEQALEERVRGLWDAKLAGDDLEAYTYEAYSQNGTMTQTQYIRARNPTLQYTAYNLKEIQERGDEATVTIDLRYRLILPARGDLNLSMDLTERWVRLNGQWYRDLEKSSKKATS